MARGEILSKYLLHPILLALALQAVHFLPRPVCSLHRAAPQNCGMSTCQFLLHGYSGWITKMHIAKLAHSNLRTKEQIVCLHPNGDQQVSTAVNQSPLPKHFLWSVPSKPHVCGRCRDGKSASGQTQSSYR